MNLALQGGRAVIIEAGHQHSPGLIRKIVRGLTQGGNKGLERGELFRIVEREQRNVLWQFQPRFPEGLEGPNGHGLGHGKERRRLVRACQHRQEGLPGVLGFVAPCHEDVFEP